MKREYKCEVTVSQPEVAYRESITQRADFNYTHKKQTGGSGQYGRVAGFMEPISEKDYEFVDAIKGGAIPNEYIPSCGKMAGRGNDGRIYGRGRKRTHAKADAGRGGRGVLRDRGEATG